MDDEYHDRSDFHLGIQVALFTYIDGVCNWDPKFLQIDFDTIVDQDSPAYIEFRHLVPSNIIPFDSIITMGKQARIRGVDKVVQKRTVRISDGRLVKTLPIVSDSWFELESILPPLKSTNRYITTQGIQTCSIDVTLFLSQSFNFTLHRGDAEPLSWFRTATSTQAAFRIVMANLGREVGSLRNRIQRNCELRDMLFRTMANDIASIKIGEENDLGEVAGHCWHRLRVLTYTYMDTYQCCGDTHMFPQNARVRQRSSHNIQLESVCPYSGQRTIRYNYITLADVIAREQFPYLDASQTNRTPNGNMAVSMAKCHGKPLCRQLPKKMLRILDFPPPYLVVSIDGGSPISHKFRNYLDPLFLYYCSESHNNILRQKYDVVGLGIYLPGNSHFIGRSYSPLGIPEFDGKYCEFDGIKGARATEIEGFLSGLRGNARIVLVVYRFALPEVVSLESSVGG